MTQTQTKRHPFTVNKVTSGYTGRESFIVVKNPGRNRVSVHAHLSRESAQMAADDLNILEMVKPWAEDDRPFKTRYAEAKVAYYTKVGR